MTLFPRPEGVTVSGDLCNEVPYLADVRKGREEGVAQKLTRFYECDSEKWGGGSKNKKMRTSHVYAPLCYFTPCNLFHRLILLPVYGLLFSPT